jgi:hypothetical protein
VRRRLTVASAVVAAASAALAASGSGSTTPACAGTALRGSFAAVAGSAGAGQISYNLRLRNRSSHACFVSGLPGLRLLGRYGNPLPTHVTPANRGALTAVRVVLAPGAYTAATARFSPDVPGPGEPVAGRMCEPKAYRARVSVPAGRGSLVVPLVPPTPVCEHGGMVLSVLIAGKNGPTHA